METIPVNKTALILIITLLSIMLISSVIGYIFMFVDDMEIIVIIIGIITTIGQGYNIYSESKHLKSDGLIFNNDGINYMGINILYADIDTYEFYYGKLNHGLKIYTNDKNEIRWSIKWLSFSLFGTSALENKIKNLFSLHGIKQG